MGYCTHEEIVAALNELLEAEIAGARVALQSAMSTAGTPLGGVTRAIQKDEAHWCAELTAQITRFGGVPSKRCGPFYGKAMAVEDVMERMAFLNRGQLWVVRRLDGLMPKVRDDRLHAMLKSMRDGHSQNIDLVTNALSPPA